MKKVLWIATFLLTLTSMLKAQEKEERNSIEVDEIEIWVKSVKLIPKTDSTVVELYLQSYLKEPRELKINTFSTGVIGSGESPLLYDSMQIGKVRINVSDRKNYRHYLLTRDEAVVLTVKTANWKKQWGKPKVFKLSVEDHLEVGKFLEYTIEL